MGVFKELLAHFESFGITRLDTIHNILSNISGTPSSRTLSFCKWKNAEVEPKIAEDYANRVLELLKMEKESFDFFMNNTFSLGEIDKVFFYVFAGDFKHLRIYYNGNTQILSLPNKSCYLYFNQTLDKFAFSAAGEHSRYKDGLKNRVHIGFNNGLMVNTTTFYNVYFKVGLIQGFYFDSKLMIP